MTENRAARGAPRFVSIRTKLATATVLIVAAIASAGFFGLRSHERQNLLHSKESAARMTCALFTASVAAAISFDDTHDMQGWLDNLGHNEEIVDAAVYGVDADAPHAVSRKLATLARAQRSLSASTKVPTGVRATFTDDVLVVEAPVVDLGGKVIGVSNVVFSLARETEAIRVMERRILGIFVGLAAAISIVLLALVQFVIVRPLGRLGQATKRLERGEQAELRAIANDEVGVLATSFDHMSSVIRAREAQIGARNRDLRLVLDNVEEGFLTLGRSGVMSEERSAILETWFGKGEGLFADYLKGIDEALSLSFRLGWEAIIDDVLPLALCLDQLPRRFAHEGRAFELRYRPIFVGPPPGSGYDSRDLSTLLVGLTDVTARVERDRAEIRQRELAAMFARILADRSAFDEFLSESRTLVSAIAQHPATGNPFVLRRNIHTLKGVSALFGLERIPSLCHALESLDDGPTPGDVDALSTVFADVEDMASRFVGVDQTGTVALRMADYTNLVDAIDAKLDHRTLRALADAMRDEQVDLRLGRLGEQVRELAQRQGHGNVTVTCAPSAIRVPEKAWTSFWSSLSHVVRNVVSHGVDTAAEREAVGKPPAVTVQFSARERDDEIEILVSDDGKGIDWEAVRRKAALLGLPHTTQADLERAIYMDGLSTREAATETSGRGVGMSAVRVAVEALGGRIEVVSELGVGTQFRFVLPTPRRDDRPRIGVTSSAAGRSGRCGTRPGGFPSDPARSCWG